MDDLALCRTCGERKPITDFDIRADTGLPRTQCKDCRRTYQRARGRPRRRTQWLVGTSELLRCRVCGELKAWTEFPRRGRDSDRLQTWCKPCFATYKAERHQKNHEREMVRIRRNTAIQVATNRVRVTEYLSAHPCVDCGETDPIVLDFDHVRGKKIDDVSRLVANGYSWTTVEAEIAKCEVRCSNCHRRVTLARRRSRGIAEPVWFYGDPGAIRTPDQQLRRLLL